MRSPPPPAQRPQQPQQPPGSQLHHRHPPQQQLQPQTPQQLQPQQQQQQQQRGGSMGPPPPPGSYVVVPGPLGGAPGGPRAPPGPPPASLLMDATSHKLLLPSRGALAALLAVPLALWAGVVGAGVAHAEPLPGGASRGDFEHPLMWFDRHVFRVWGPLLPLLTYLVRLAAAAIRNPARATNNNNRNPHHTNSYTPPASRGLRAAPGLRPGVTLPLLSLLVYGAVIAVRVALYVGHVRLQRAVALVVMSDHLLLAASIVTCFQAELLMCLSDIYKAELLRGTDPWVGARQLVVVAAMVTSMFVLVFVYGDMYCTARWYHEPAESLGALAAGALLFHLPVVAWLALTARRHLPRSLQQQLQK